MVETGPAACAAILSSTKGAARRSCTIGNVARRGGIELEKERDLVNAIRLLCSSTLLAVAPAQASEFCEGIKQAITDLTAGKPATEIRPLPGSDSCKPVITLGGGRTYHCSWEFSYRAEAATTAFESFVSSVQKCEKVPLDMAKDQSVNHPDFYDLREFHLNEGKVSISIKDKGGLQNTFVFVSVSGESEP